MKKKEIDKLAKNLNELSGVITKETINDGDIFFASFKLSDDDQKVDPGKGERVNFAVDVKGNSLALTELFHEILERSKNVRELEEIGSSILAGVTIFLGENPEFALHFMKGIKMATMSSFASIIKEERKKDEKEA